MEKLLVQERLSE